MSADAAAIRLQTYLDGLYEGDADKINPTRGDLGRNLKPQKRITRVWHERVILLRGDFGVSNCAVQSD